MKICNECNKVEIPILPANRKYCSDCVLKVRSTKNRSYWRKYNKTNRNLVSQKICISAWARSKKGKASSKIRGTRRRLKLYNLTEDQVASILKDQKHRCAICKVSFSKVKYVFDHSHTTGKFRGFLCGACNRGIGILKESKDLFLSAIEYLGL